MIRVVAALFALSLGAASAQAGEIMVHVGHNLVDPAEIKIEAGDTVVFHNIHEMPGGHTIAADDGSFESPPLAKDEQWKHTFEKPGTYGVHVKQHPTAKGVVVVE